MDFIYYFIAFILFILCCFVFFQKDQHFTTIDGYLVELDMKKKDPYKDARRRLNRAKKNGSIKKVRKFEY